MSPSGEPASPVATFPKRLLLCTGIHAAIVVPALALNLGLALGALPASAALQRTADWAGLLLWRPINALIENRIEIFFMLVPFNSLLYGLLAAALWQGALRHRSRPPQP